MENLLFKLILKQIQDQHLIIQEDYKNTKVELDVMTRKYNDLKNNGFPLLAHVETDKKQTPYASILKNECYYCKAKKRPR